MSSIEGYEENATEVSYEISGGFHSIRCRTCIYSHHTSDKYGQCRAQPPRVFKGGDTAFPEIILDTDWCGKHPEIVKKVLNQSIKDVNASSENLDNLL